MASAAQARASGRVGGQEVPGKCQLVTREDMVHYLDVRGGWDLKECECCFVRALSLGAERALTMHSLSYARSVLHKQLPDSFPVAPSGGGAMGDVLEYSSGVQAFGKQGESASPLELYSCKSILAPFVCVEGMLLEWMAEPRVGVLMDLGGLRSRLPAVLANEGTPAGPAPPAAAAATAPAAVWSCCCRCSSCWAAYRRAVSFAAFLVLVARWPRVDTVWKAHLDAYDALYPALAGQLGAGRQAANDAFASVLVQVLGVKKSADLQEGFGFFVQHLLSGGLEKVHAEGRGKGGAGGKAGEKAQGRGKGESVMEAADNGAAGDGGREGKNGQWRENMNGHVWEGYVDGIAWILQHGGGDGREFRCSHCSEGGSNNNGGSVQVNDIPKGMYVSGAGATEFALAFATELSKPESCTNACMYIFDGNNANKVRVEEVAIEEARSRLGRGAGGNGRKWESGGTGGEVAAAENPSRAAQIPSGAAENTSGAAKITSGAAKITSGAAKITSGAAKITSGPAADTSGAAEALAMGDASASSDAASAETRPCARADGTMRGDIEKLRVPFLLLVALMWPASILDMDMYEGKRVSEGDGIRCIGTKRKKGELPAYLKPWPGGVNLVACLREMLLGEPCYRPASPAAPSAAPAVATNAASAPSTAASASSTPAAATNAVAPNTSAATGNAAAAAPVEDAEACGPTACGGSRCGAAGCGKVEGSGVRLRSCGGCGKVAYCSRECQKAHWPSHKLTCPGRTSGNKSGNSSGKPGEVGKGRVGEQGEGMRRNSVENSGECWEGKKGHEDFRGKGIGMRRRKMSKGMGKGMGKRMAKRMGKQMGKRMGKGMITRMGKGIGKGMCKDTDKGGMCKGRYGHGGKRASDRMALYGQAWGSGDWMDPSFPTPSCPTHCRRCHCRSHVTGPGAALSGAEAAPFQPCLVVADEEPTPEAAAPPVSFCHAAPLNKACIPPCTMTSVHCHAEMLPHRNAPPPPACVLGPTLISLLFAPLFLSASQQQQRICLCPLTPHTLLLLNQPLPSSFSSSRLSSTLPPSSSPSVPICLDLPNPSRSSPLVLSPIPPLSPPPSHPHLSPSPFVTSSSPPSFPPHLPLPRPSTTPLSHILPMLTNPPSHGNNT
ncbi:unnamed protein product [Closterium sp. Naga37s-1]|nr:unnamed protein product [Closterium sp. Naga37s-1]